MMFLRNAGQKTKLIFLLILPFFLILTLLSAYSSWLHYRQVKADMKDRAVSVTRLFSALSEDALVTHDSAGLDRLVRKAFQEEDIRSIKILGRDERLLKEGSRTRPGEDLLEITGSIVAGESAAGSIVIGFSNDKIRASMMSYLGHSIVEVFFGVMAAALVFVAVMNRFFFKPLTAISAAVREIAGPEGIGGERPSGNGDPASVQAALAAFSDHIHGMKSKFGAFSAAVSQARSSIAGLSGSALNKTTLHRSSVEETLKVMQNLNNSTGRIAASTESLAELTEKAAVFIVEMNASMEKISGSSHVFYDSAQETAASIEEMIASIRKIAENLNSLNASAESTASSVSEITASVKHVEENARESVALAEKVNLEASGKGMSALTAATEGMAEIRSNMNRLAEVIHVLGKRSHEIEGILRVVSDITDKTNLLSLNAAILAAQAGESGKSFSVVADEIRNLADRTALSTKEISSLIKSVQDETRSSVAMASGVIEAVDRGSKLFRDVAGVLNLIIESSRASTEMARTIQNATAEEVVAINQIAGTVSTITDQITHISDATGEQSRGSRFILQASEAVRDASFQVKKVLEEQHGETQGITGVIENVGFLALEIADEIKGQKRQGAEIIRGIDRFGANAQEMLSVIKELDGAVRSFGLDTEGLK